MARLERMEMEASEPEVQDLNKCREAPKEYRSECLGNKYFNITVFLPPESPMQAAYYNSTRFSWDSQIANFCIGPHVLFGDMVWPQRCATGEACLHNPNTPRAGVGLAAEFGCNDQGELCPSGSLNYPAGAMNGVLGYSEAGAGEPFLKIGVGKLKKADDSSDYDPDYPYEFYEFPQWRYEKVSSEEVKMSQEMSLEDGRWGYVLNTTIKVYPFNFTVRVITTLQNSGNETFHTPHYYHNLLSVDRAPIVAGKDGWNLTRMVPDSSSSVQSESVNYYFWREFGRMVLIRDIPEDEVLKVNFNGAVNKDASSLWGAVNSMLVIDSSTTLVDAERASTTQNLYDFRVEVTRNTISPMPFQMLELAPGELATLHRDVNLTLEGYEAPRLGSGSLVFKPSGAVYWTAMAITGLALGATVIFKKSVTSRLVLPSPAPPAEEYYVSQK